ncbi:MAG: hypothetical protein EA417_07825 [Gammaproteobacteria bacterium]|nr:MAG: hypothetical protein EA417_07825 [Gammaproteobacteria bacterium]
MIARSLTLLLALTLAHAAGAALQPFDTDAFDEIRTRYANETVLVLIWSLDCHHCKDGMAKAAGLLDERPGLNLVLVNVDPADEAAAVASTLQKLGLSEADNWQFVDAPAARLRATIDPQWFGELPRSYLIDAEGNSAGFSGRISQDALDHWRQRSR